MKTVKQLEKEILELKEENNCFKTRTGEGEANYITWYQEINKIKEMKK